MPTASAIPTHRNIATSQDLNRTLDFIAHSISP